MIVVYRGPWRRNPMPRPMPSRHCTVRSPKRMSAMSWIVSNGPHGKFMATRVDHWFTTYYTMINLENKAKRILLIERYRMLSMGMGNPWRSSYVSLSFVEVECSFKRTKEKKGDEIWREILISLWRVTRDDLADEEKSQTSGNRNVCACHSVFRQLDVEMLRTGDAREARS